LYEILQTEISGDLSVIDQLLQETDLCVLWQMRHYHTLGHSVEMLGRVRKSADVSETGVAEEGQRRWRKPEPQHN
jgi:hypothetical protein